MTQTRGDLEQLAEMPVDINPKGHLQELLQSISPRSPVYELVSQSGPEHEKTFVSQVVWEGIVLGQGSGRSKKQAETAAAIEAMQLRRWEKNESRQFPSAWSAPKLGVGGWTAERGTPFGDFGVPSAASRAQTGLSTSNDEAREGLPKATSTGNGCAIDSVTNFLACGSPLPAIDQKQDQP